MLGPTMNLDHLLAFDNFAHLDSPPTDWIHQHQQHLSQQHRQQQQQPHSQGASRSNNVSPRDPPSCLMAQGLSPREQANLEQLLGTSDVTLDRPLLLDVLPDHQAVSTRRRPWDHILTSTSYNPEESTVRPYQHAYGYARMQRWTASPVSSWSVAGAERVRVLLQEQTRPILRDRWQRLSDLELVEHEERFIAIVDYIRQHVCEAVDVPLVVLRRTGEIVCANEAWARLCQTHVSCFNDGRLCLYQLLSEQLSIDIFER